MSAKFRRLNITIPPELGERAKQIDNVSEVCAKAIEAACDALESGEPQSLTFGFRVTRSLDVQRKGWEEGAGTLMDSAAAGGGRA